MRHHTPTAFQVFRPVLTPVYRHGSAGAVPHPQPQLHQQQRVDQTVVQDTNQIAVVNQQQQQQHQQAVVPLILAPQDPALRTFQAGVNANLGPLQ